MLPVVLCCGGCYPARRPHTQYPRLPEAVVFPLERPTHQRYPPSRTAYPLPTYPPTHPPTPGLGAGGGGGGGGEGGPQAPPWWRQCTPGAKGGAGRGGRSEALLGRGAMRCYPHPATHMLPTSHPPSPPVPTPYPPSPPEAYPACRRLPTLPASSPPSFLALAFLPILAAASNHHLKIIISSYLIIFLNTRPSDRARRSSRSPTPTTPPPRASGWRVGSGGIFCSEFSSGIARVLSALHWRVVVLRLPGIRGRAQHFVHRWQTRRRWCGTSRSAPPGGYPHPYPHTYPRRTHSPTRRAPPVRRLPLPPDDFFFASPIHSPFSSLQGRHGGGARDRRPRSRGDASSFPGTVHLPLSPAIFPATLHRCCAAFSLSGVCCLFFASAALALQTDRAPHLPTTPSPSVQAAAAAVDDVSAGASADWRPRLEHAQHLQARHHTPSTRGTTR